jgi:uncharacterized protein
MPVVRPGILRRVGDHGRPDRSCLDVALAQQNRCSVNNPIDTPVKCIYILRMSAWDESKRRENLHRQKIDLSELEPVFDYPMITTEDNRESYGELRQQSLGMWQGKVVFLVWTPRGDDVAHLISKDADEYFRSI